MTEPRPDLHPDAPPVLRPQEAPPGPRPPDAATRPPGAGWAAPAWRWLAGAWQRRPRPLSPADWRAARHVLHKEWIDALRDRRTLLMLLVSAVLMGPLMLVLLSVLASDAEQRAQARELVLSGAQHAPSLVNYLERQGYVLRDAPPEHERLLRERRLEEAVLVIPPDFERALRRGERPVVALITSSANLRSQAGAARAQALLNGFSREQATLRLALRGVSPALTQPLRIEERDVASPAARASRLTAMLPFFVLMAVLYGTMNAALDATAGERERGSLAPLLLSPVSAWALVLGKWAAAAAVGLLIAALSSLSFLPGQWLLRSEALASLFHYGWAEALGFLWVLAPLACAMSAVLMAVAMRARSVKEAQAGGSLVVMAASLLPLVSLLGPGGEQLWHLGVPALAQATLMNRVLQGEPLGWLAPLATWTVCAALTWLALALAVRQMRQAVAR